jgi:aconitate hydratase
MGILPLQFIDGMDRKKLNLKGSELITIVDIEKGVSPRENVKVEIKYADGSVKAIDALCRIDTDNEILYYENGGILQYVLRKMI